MYPDAIRRTRVLPFNERFKKDCVRIRTELGIPAPGLKPEQYQHWKELVEPRAHALVKDYGLSPLVFIGVALYIACGDERTLAYLAERVCVWRHPILIDGELKQLDGMPLFSLTIEVDLTPYTTRADWDWLFTHQVKPTLEEMARKHGVPWPRGRRPAVSDDTLQRSLTWWQWHKERKSPDDILNRWQSEHPDDSGYPDSFDAVYDAVREIDRLMAPVVSSPEP